MPRNQLDEPQMIDMLCRQLDAVLDASPFTPGCKTIAVISTAARYARRTSMHPQVAAAMLADYIVRGEPI